MSATHPLRTRNSAMPNPFLPSHTYSEMVSMSSISLSFPMGSMAYLMTVPSTSYDELYMSFMDSVNEEGTSFFYIGLMDTLFSG